MAALYASVGHGGASGYLAILAIAGYGPDELRPIALTLNVVVSAMGTWRFSGHFQQRLFWPFAGVSIPAAFLAGRFVHLDPRPYNILLGLILIYAAWRVLLASRRSGSTVNEAAGEPLLLLAIVMGALIGLISGMIGIGGGIFLSPVLILAGWASPRQAAAVVAPFILLNSIAALAGLLWHHGGLPVELPHLALLAGSVLIAGFAGATLGATQLNQLILNRLLAIVLLLAAIKMIATA